MIKAKVHGVSQLSARFKAMQREVPALMVKATLAGARPIRDEAAELAPRASGWVTHEHMADNMLIEAKKSGYGCKAKIGPAETGEEGLDVWMRQGLEEGTSQMPAQPFLRPALDTKRNEALQAFGEVITANKQRLAR